MAGHNEMKVNLAEPVDPRAIESLRQSFKEFDINGDGYISKDELSKGISKIGLVISDSELDEMIQLVDKDGNGVIDFDEFIQLMDCNCLVQNTDKEIVDLFRFFDVNNDGFISENELEQMMKKLGEKVRKKDIRRMIEMGDKNQDNQISFQEFKDMIESGDFMNM